MAISKVQTALAELREYAKWSQARDRLVCQARRQGATYTEIMDASGLAKGTVHTILKNAGLTTEGTQ